MAEDLDIALDEDTPVIAQLVATGTTFTLEDAPTHGMLSLSTSGAFSYTPAPDYFGSDSFTFRADDSNVATVRITVRPVNDAPVISSDAMLSTTTNTPLDLTLSTVSITDVDTTAGFSLVVAGGEHYNVSGTVVTAEPGFVGVLSVSVQVSDGAALSNSLTLSVDVRSEPPVVEGQAAFPSMLEEGTLAITSADFDIADADSAAHSVVVDAGENYTVEADGSSIRGALDFFGMLAVNVRVFDGSSYSAPFAFAVSVTNVNDAPVLSAPAGRTTAIGVDLPLLASDFSVFDADGDALMFVVGPGDNYLVAGTTVEPTDGFEGVLTVPVSFSDGTLSSNVELLTVSIANTPPNATSTPLEIDEDTLTMVSLTLFDPDQGQSLSFEIVDGDNYQLGGAENEFVPDEHYAGALTVSVMLSDGLSTRTITIPVTVLPINDPPTLALGATMLSTGLATPITLSLDDVDANDVDEGDTLTLHVADGTGYTYDGLEVTPTAGAGVVYINVYVSDFDGEESAPIALPLTVENTLAVIVAQLSSPSVQEDGAEYAITVADLDIEDPDVGQQTNIIVVADQPGYTVGATANAINPNPNFSGTLTVTVKINDGIEDGPELTTFELEVTPLPDAPVAAAQSGSVGGNGLLQGSGLSVGATDPDGPTAFTVVAVDSVQTANMGTVRIRADGTYTYLAPRGYIGSDTFSYQVNDGGLDSSPATVTITVEAPIIWYVDSAYVAPVLAPPTGTADGRQSRPYATLDLATGASSANQHIHVKHRSGPYTSAAELQLDDDQILLGDGGPTINAPRVVVRGGNVIEGVTLTGAAGITGATGVTIDDATLTDVSVQVTGAGVSLLNVSGVALLHNVDVATTAGIGLRFGDTGYTGRQGDIRLDDVSVVAAGGAALMGTKLLHLDTLGGTNTLSAARGSVLNVDDCALSATFATATSTNATLVASTPGLRVVNASGLLSIGTTSLTDSTNDAVAVTGSPNISVSLGALAITMPRSNGITLENNTGSAISFGLSSLTTTAGRGLYVNNSGDVSVTGTPALASTGATAVDIRTASASPWSFGGLMSSSTSDGVRYSGLSPTQRALGSFSAGQITVTGANTSNGAGLRIKETNGNVTIARLDVNNSHRGLVLDDATGSFTLTSVANNGGTFSNLADDGVYLNGTGAVALNRLTITSPRGNGVRVVDGTTTTSLTIADSTITNPGTNAEADGDLEHAINLGTGVQISSSVSVSSSTLTSTRDTAVLLAKTSGNASLQVTNSTINFGGTGSGIVAGLDTSTGGALAVTVDGTTLAATGSPTGVGVNVYSAGTGSVALSATVRNSTFVAPVDMGDDAIVVVGAAPGSTTVTIGGATAADGNYIGGFFNGIKVTGAGVSSTLSGSIRQNRVGYLRAPAERRVQGDGIVVMLDPNSTSGTTQGSVRIANNQIATKLGVGIYAFARNGGSHASHWLTTFVADNVVSAPSQPSDGIWLRSAATTRLCAGVTGNNSASNGVGFFDILVSEASSNGIKLTDPPANLSALNNNDAVGIVGSIDMTDVSTCPCVGTCP